MSRGRQLAVGIAAAGMIIATIAFLASTRLPLAPSAELQSGLPVGDDWPCEVPKASSIMLNGSTDISKPDPNCDQYQKYSYAETFTYVQVAEAWAAAGLNPKYCPAAVVIAAGECVPLNPPHVGGCNLKSTGASGLYQTDWVREAEDNPNIRKVVGDDWKERIRNPCENSRYVWGTMFPPAPPISYNGGCFTGDFPIDQKYTPPLRIECDTPELCPAAGAGSRCDWNFSLGHCDWLGPFCHWQMFGYGTGPSCCAWTGGANCDNPRQPQGFPGYYQQAFLERNTGKSWDDPAQWGPHSYQQASEICFQALGKAFDGP